MDNRDKINKELTNRVASGCRGDSIGHWYRPVEVRESDVVEYSLGNWTCNLAVGCSFGCPFCRVPSASGSLLSEDLQRYGVDNPHTEWGKYALLRQWDKTHFLRSLDRTWIPFEDDRDPRGNRAILLSSTTDPYQSFPHQDPEVAAKLEQSSTKLIRKSLKSIRYDSDLNVRILTRSPHASRDFERYLKMGDRLLFGMSLPTLRDDLAAVYEPKVPSPSERLKTLQKAREMGINIYVVLGPTFPESDRMDLRSTLGELKQLEPVTIFHEPVNISPSNLKRMEEHGKASGRVPNLNPFKSRKHWLKYAVRSFRMVEEVAHELDTWDRLHLWPHASLGSKTAFDMVEDVDQHCAWLSHWWNRVSEWPGIPEPEPDQA